MSRLPSAGIEYESSDPYLTQSLFSHVLNTLIKSQWMLFDMKLVQSLIGTANNANNLTMDNIICHHIIHIYILAEMLFILGG